MKKLTKKYKDTQSCTRIMLNNLFVFKLDYYEFQRMLKRKLIKAWWIGYATGINEYSSKIKNNKTKNKALESIDSYLKSLEKQDYKVLKDKVLRLKEKKWK